MTATRLRQWHGVKEVAPPSGCATSTRIHTTSGDDQVLDALAEHLGLLRRRDLAAHSRQEHPASVKQRRRNTNTRKHKLTAASSSRWASTVFTGTDKQIALARRCQVAHRDSLRAAITTITARLAAPVGKATQVSATSRRQGKRPVNGYANRAQRYAKQQRLQILQARLARVEGNLAARHVHVVEGGRGLAHMRHHLDTAGLTEEQWRRQWECARWRVTANGSSDEQYGNLTIRITPDGKCSIRLPRPLEHLANTTGGRYQLSGRVVFAHRGGEWLTRITTGKAVAYTFTRRPGRGGVYLSAAWSTAAGGGRWKPTPTTGGKPDIAVAVPAARAVGEILGVDFNDGHLAVRHLDRHGNPVGSPITIGFELTGTSAHRDAQVRHTISTLLRVASDRGVEQLAVEDLDFADARSTGRETMGSGRRGKLFRRTVSGLPTAVFRDRLTSMTDQAGVALYAVNPAYTSVWGGQHWQRPYRNVTRHHGAAAVIGRRAQGFRGRRREGVTSRDQRITCRRATNQAVNETVGEFHLRGVGELNTDRRAGVGTPPPGNRYPGTRSRGHPDRLKQ